MSLYKVSDYGAFKSGRISVSPFNVRDGTFRNIAVFDMTLWWIFYLFQNKTISLFENLKLWVRCLYTMSTTVPYKFVTISVSDKLLCENIALQMKLELALKTIKYVNFAHYIWLCYWVNDYAILIDRWGLGDFWCYS